MISEEDDLYAIMGCSQNSTCEQIAAEYRIKARSLHPDKAMHNMDDERNDLNQRFQHLQFAKDILTNPKKRQHYHLWLACGSMQFPLKQWMQNQEKLHQV